MRHIRSGGWQGVMLWVDLSSRSITRLNSLELFNGYIGGRGVGARLGWQHVPRGMAPFDEQHPLMILTGPLTGTTAPFSGRTTVCGLAPQGYPVPWFTRSSFGGHWGPELKYAGYDGLVITGISEHPVYLMIRNHEVKFCDARPYWGTGIYRTQQQLMAIHGRDCRILTIGQAGEQLSRIAVLATETESASGQGGFGAVAGAKKLKAIVVKGDQGIPIAHPQRFLTFSRLVAQEAHGSHGWPRTRKLCSDRVRKYGERYHACTQQCHVHCWDARFYTAVPGTIHPDRSYAGQVDCIAQLFPGPPNTFYNWNLGFEAGFEIGRYANDFGLNHWELLVGIIPWLRLCHQEGLFNTLDGLLFNLDDPRFWLELLRKITFREGIGEALSQGGVRASQILGFGQELIPQFYCAWGYAGHWDGHGDKINFIYFPFWLVAALQWAVDVRDPISSAHGYVQNVMGWSKSCSPDDGLDWPTLIAIGEKVYGSRHCLDPQSGYRDKAIPAIYHQHRSVLKDSLPVDDQIYPRIFSRKTSDHFAHIRFEGQTIPGPDFEYHLYSLATGKDISKPEFERMCERVITLERLLAARNFNRSRRDDENIIPYFATPETKINPFLKKPQQMDPAAFRSMLDDFYSRRGWNPETGLPTGETIRQLGLNEIESADMT